MSTAMIHVRVDKQAKQRAAETLEAMGLTVSEAERVFPRRVATERAIQFSMEVPNAAGRAAMEQARTSSRGRFAGPDALFESLGDRES